ncbi:hypothetical protein Syun_019054 [Stephania yunnanensis]|uniref:Zinc-finger domain-containing protein n=1 Tax=Stephania yunnanensis TaxID=152371 RepID=A0AAP0ITD3_9MAGN
MQNEADQLTRFKAFVAVGEGWDTPENGDEVEVHYIENPKISVPPLIAVLPPPPPTFSPNATPHPQQKRKKTNARSSEEEEKENNGGDSASLRRTRNKLPRVQLVGFKIDDSQNEKTCRPKTMHFDVSCKNEKNDKACPFIFCYKCLINRYGEKIEDMEVLCDWKCPKCIGIYNRSFCMKRRGNQPTGILAHTVKGVFPKLSYLYNLIHKIGRFFFFFYGSNALWKGVIGWSRFGWR